MKVNRHMVIRTGLQLLNEAGLEQLSLRTLAKALKIQAPSVYWHFKSKQELIDEMASLVLAEGAPLLVPANRSPAWHVRIATFGKGLRKTLMTYRDGARMISGTRLTNTEWMKAVEAIAAHVVAAGFSGRQTIVLLNTVYNYTLSFVTEEQAVFPRPGQRSADYDLGRRRASLANKDLPIMRQAGSVLFDNFERRFKEGLDLILQGAAVKLASRPARKRSVVGR